MISRPLCTAPERDPIERHKCGNGRDVQKKAPPHSSARHFLSNGTECNVQRLPRKGKKKETIYIRNLGSHRLTDVRLKFIRRTFSEFKLAVTMSINIRPLLLA